MRKIRFFVPGKVRGKGRPRFTVRGKYARAYTEKKTADYEMAVKRWGLAALAERAPLEGPIKLQMVAILEPPKSVSKTKRLQMLADDIRPTVKPDLDNVMKMIDALNGVCFRDDSQIVSAELEKRYGENAGLYVTIEQMPTRDLFTENGRQSKPLVAA